MKTIKGKTDSNGSNPAQRQSTLLLHWSPNVRFFQTTKTLHAKTNTKKNLSEVEWKNITTKARPTMSCKAQLGKQKTDSVKCKVNRKGS